MKTKFWFIFIISFSLVINCKDSDNELPEEVEPELIGNVIYMRGQSLEMAMLNSMHLKNYYGNALYQTRPVWSHDGSRFAAIDLVNSAEASDMSLSFEIKIVDISNGSITHWRIDDSKNINLNGPLTWSPDGNTIAFLANRGSNKVLYLNTQTGDTIHTKLSLDFDSMITALAWHPNGKNITVNVNSSHSNFQLDNHLWMIEPYGTKLKNQIFLTSRNIVEYLDWNSDGSQLLYSHINDDIFIINSDGSGQRKIPDIFGHAPCWSKDGKYVMFTGIAGTSGSTLIFGIFVTDTDGSFKKMLLKNAGYCDWF